MSNPPNVQFSPSLVIDVQVLPTPTNLSAPNINTAALFTVDQPSWIAVQDYAIYTNATDVGVDFGTSSNAFKIATAFFAQQPNPIGTGGYLAIVPRVTGTPAALIEQDITYTAKATGTGGNDITIAYTSGGTPGAEVVTVTADAISVQIADGVSTAQQVANAINASANASALVSVAISGTATSAQSVVVATNLTGGSGSGTEPVLNAIARTVNSVYYFGILVDSQYNASATVFASLCSYIQTLQKLFFYASSHVADFQTNGILYDVQQATENNTRCLYYNDGTAIDTPAFAAAYAGRALTTNFEGSLTTATMNLKQLIGFTPDQTLTTTLLAQAQSAGVDVYISIGGVPSLYTSGANQWFDEVYNQYWFAFALQTAGFNYLAGSSTKIPQTEVGMEGLKNVYRQVCQQAITNGFVAPGTWNASTSFGPNGTLVRNVFDVGYYVYSQPITQQNQTQRTARIAPLVQIAIKAAGAIHHSDVIVNVNL